MKITAMIIMTVIAVIALAAFMAVIICLTEDGIKIRNLEERVRTLERREKDLTEAGKIVSKDLRVTQTQIDEAIKRAKL